MSADEIEFPSWMPSGAQQICTDYYSVAKGSSDLFPQALEVLQSLAMRLEMKEAWEELKHFPDVSPSDLMGSTFLVWLCASHNRLLFRLAPRLKSDHELASKIRAVADYLRTASPAMLTGTGITNATLQELECVAAFYERSAKNSVSDLSLRIAPPPKKALVHNADEIAFVNTMCNWLGRQTGRRRPYNLIAVLANVAFDMLDRQWDADKVKHCWGSRKK